ncbi:PepSY domain-containing protein [Jiella mangrovi]|uniref:PepSY domain-containing protein n=1 Tax=Jiella mangrovi TaxID=2821407 RepID=A0ABS4BKD2_9HYPH|nr:PepSY domain-containing protein [Jiella mangrovi]MBP0616430.1 PepSY domain-containing protein [Jiella mangrovi]
MRKANWTYGIIAAMAIATAAPAAAQTVQIGRDGVKIVPTERMRDDHRRDERHDRRSDRISEREAVRIAHRQGLRDVREVTRTRNSYRVAGLDRRGHRIRVDIDRNSGAVIRVR